MSGDVPAFLPLLISDFICLVVVNLKSPPVSIVQLTVIIQQFIEGVIPQRRSPFWTGEGNKLGWWSQWIIHFYRDQCYLMLCKSRRNGVLWCASDAHLIKRNVLLPQNKKNTFKKLLVDVAMFFFLIFHAVMADLNKRVTTEHVVIKLATRHISLF